MTDDSKDGPSADPNAAAVRAAIRSVRRGDRDAFARIIDAYQRRLFGLALMMTRDPAAADEVTQDIGVRWVWTALNKGNVHASFNRNLYNDKINSLIIDNPFRATDAAYVSTSVPGGLPRRAPVRLSRTPRSGGAPGRGPPRPLARRSTSSRPFRRGRPGSKGPVGAMCGSG